MMFFDEAHEGFFRERITVFPADCYYTPLVYLLGLCEETRGRFERIYHDGIKPECLTEGWQTSTTRRIVRLAFNLFNGCASDALGEAVNAWCYAPEEVFCCAYAPYFAEALRLRYPEYFWRGGNFS